MKQLNFNEPKILKSLLDKTKTSTIRKAWKLCPKCNGSTSVTEKHKYRDIKLICNNCNLKGSIDKPCEYKVDEIIEIIWTGGIGYLQDIQHIDGIDEEQDNSNVILGKVKITSIEQIEIGKAEMNETLKHLYYIGSENTHLLMPGYEEYGDTLKALSKSEGFKEAKEMFEYLEKYANGLEETKKFYLIKYKWVKDVL